MHPLLERQEQLEAQGMAEGVKRFRERLRAAQEHGRGSQTGAARKLLQMGIEPLSAAFEALVQESESRRGPKHYVLRWIKLVGCDELAYLTVKTVLDVVSHRRHERWRGEITATIRGAKLRDIAFTLTQSITDELRYRRLREQAPGLFNYRVSSFTTSNTAHMKRSLDATVHYAAVDTSDLEMTHQVRQVVGTKLVDLLISATGLVGVRQAVRSKGHTNSATRETLVIPTDETLEWLDTRNGGLEALFPIFMPMVVPPLPWSPGRAGGYRFGLRGKHDLVRGISKEHREAIRMADMPAVYTALNAIQDTAWRINPHVYALLTAIVARGGDVGGVPALENEPMPAKPADIATNPVSRKAWRKVAHAAKERNHLRKLKAMVFHKTLATATAMKDEAAIYFPCNLDFRGRVYPVVNYLTPQGDDLSKALLTFAHGKPLGQHGGTWLALHGANVMDETPEGLKLSKATLQERVNWIVEHTELIERIATDPFSNREWAQPNVDKPLQFYAFCCEWAEFMKLHRAGRGEEFVSSLPCAMDGTCNGLQHFAAILRDPIGGAAVNLSPSERPQDIYQRISDVVLSRLELDATSNEYARLWLQSGLVNRKLAKRPTMTFGYGSKKYGFQQQLIDYVRTHDRWSELRPIFSEEGKNPGSLLGRSCGYMSTLIWEALQATVVKASVGMQWMQQAARLVVSVDKCVSWRVPATNFPVRQEYMQVTSRQIETVLQGRIYKPRLYTQTDHADIIKQANAVAPNFVHSLDAAALMLTVNAAVDRGVQSFGMVHDSYATHAGDAEVLAEVTREMFVRLYTEHDVIEEFGMQLFAQLGDPTAKFPAPPEKGALDLNCVRESLYFFS